MADSVTSRVLFNGAKRYAAVFSNLSDGTGESAVAKVDISTLEGAPTKVKIMRVSGNTVGMTVSVLFDHTTDDRVLILNGEFASAGDTGDILFTTTGHTSGDTYYIVLDVEPA